MIIATKEDEMVSSTIVGSNLQQYSMVTDSLLDFSTAEANNSSSFRPENQSVNKADAGFRGRWTEYSSVVGSALTLDRQ